MMSKYLRKKNVIVHEITKMSHDPVRFNSFKVVVV